MPFSDRNCLWLVLGLAALLRLAAAGIVPDQHFPDAQSYRDVAAAIWTSHRFDNPYIMPLYPLAVALTGGGWGQLTFDIVLSTISVYLIYHLTLILFKDRRCALLAGFAAAIYPYFIFYSIVGLTETLFIALLLTAFVAWYRGWFTLAAIVAVLSILTRPTIDLLIPCLVVYFSLFIHRLTFAAACKNTAVYALIYCALMTPWWLHNFNAYGTFVRLNLGSGLALYSGNNPHNQSGGVSDVNLDASQFDPIIDPVARDRAMRDAAISYMIADPPRFVKLAGLKFMRFWRPWPFAESYAGRGYVIASLLSFFPVLLLALAQLLTSNLRALARVTPILLFIGYLTAIHMIIVGSIRYRLPIEPFLIVLAAPGFRKITARFTGPMPEIDQQCKA